jgi:hypothetical protein
VKHVCNYTLTYHRCFLNRHGFWEEGVVWRSGFGAAGRELLLMSNYDQFDIHAFFERCHSLVINGYLHSGHIYFVNLMQGIAL